MLSFTPHVVFAGGGTAGHLFPGIAVAKQLVRDAPSTRVTFAGTGRTFEREHVHSAGFDYLALPSAPLPRGAAEAVRFIADHLRGSYRAARFLREQGVSLVVGLGSYASVPMLRAARRRGVPYIVLEQNAVPGRATRWFAPRAQLVCLSFPEAGTRLPSGCLARVTGNPVRRGSAQLAALKVEAASRRLQQCGKMPHQQPRLLILGGSGGARTLNEHAPLALYKASPSLAGWEIVHQSGERELEATRELYGKLALSAVVVPFIDHMARALLQSELVISRAGGTTLAELAAAGVPAILAPYPKATDDHQRKNADAFVAAGGALLVDEREIQGRFDDALAVAVTTLASDPQLRHRMSAAMSHQARPEAARTVAKLIGDLLRSRQFASAA